MLPPVKPPVPTMNVIEKSTGNIILINAFRFNPDIHKMIEELKPIKQKEAPVEAPENVIEEPKEPTPLVSPAYNLMKRNELMKLAKQYGVKFSIRDSREEIANKLTIGL